MTVWKLHLFWKSHFNGTSRTIKATTPEHSSVNFWFMYNVQSPTKYVYETWMPLASKMSIYKFKNLMSYIFTLLRPQVHVIPRKYKCP